MVDIRGRSAYRAPIRALNVPSSGLTTVLLNPGRLMFTQCLRIVCPALALICSCAAPSPERTSNPVTSAATFLAAHEKLIRPLEKASNLAWWNANTTGRDEDFQAKEEAQNRIDAALADPVRFAELKALREALRGASPQDPAYPLVRRQVEVLYLQYLEKQVDPDLLKRMAARSNAVEKAFNVFRAQVDGKALTDSEVRKVLKESKDSALRQRVWEASKEVGRVVEADLKELVRLRNEAARKLGFKDYHVMMLELNEQSQDRVLGLFDELHALTSEPFRLLKVEVDAHLAAQYGIAPAALQAWHYQDPFFQESPSIYETNLDTAFAGTDIPELCRKFYSGIGLPIEDVLTRSDLYEKAGKSPHAFCTDIDREGDVRVLANIVPNERWMSTMLHELGHAVYSSKNIPASLPYALRTEAHILTTEGIAMLFERFSSRSGWLAANGVSIADPVAFDRTGALMRRNQLLVFAAWCQVMFRFERGMYANPEQDLNKLWWDLVETYQLIARPRGRSAPDYGSKVHIVSAPAYYHNYLMGQLFASQLHAAIASRVLHTPPGRADYAGHPEVGAYLKEKVFGPGRSLPWNDLTAFATGEKLNARAFAAELDVR